MIESLQTKNKKKS